jgi:hypothetical protein
MIPARFASAVTMTAPARLNREVSHLPEDLSPDSGAGESLHIAAHPRQRLSCADCSPAAYLDLCSVIANDLLQLSPISRVQAAT